MFLKRWNETVIWPRCMCTTVTMVKGCSLACFPQIGFHVSAVIMSRVTNRPQASWTWTHRQHKVVSVCISAPQSLAFDPKGCCSQQRMNECLVSVYADVTHPINTKLSRERKPTLIHYILKCHSGNWIKLTGKGTLRMCFYTLKVFRFLSCGVKYLYVVFIQWNSRSKSKLQYVG